MSKRAISSFTTHTGQTFINAELRAALLTYAIETRKLAFRIYIADDYASHVSQAVKASELIRDLVRADAIERGEIEQGQLNTLSARQSLNTILTGECVPLLGKTPDGAQPKLQAKEDGDE